MTSVVICPYCGLSQDEPEGAKECIRCGGHIDVQARTPSQVFICYTRRDAEFVNQLTSDLKALGVNSWRDVDNITEQRRANASGWRSAIEDALQCCTEMLVILSPEAVASIEVEAEWNDFASRKLPIFPILAQECKVPYFLRRYQIWDLRTDYQRQVRQLANILLGKNSPPTPSAPLSTPNEPARQGQTHFPVKPVSTPFRSPSTPSSRLPSQQVKEAQPSAGADLTVIGKELWRLDLAGEVKIAPKVGPDGRVYVITYNGMLSQVTPKGTSTWQVVLGGASSHGSAIQPVITDQGNLVVAHNNALKLIAKDGKAGWTINNLGMLSCAPAVARDGSLFITNNNSVIWGISKDGEIMWKRQLSQIMGGGTWPSPVVGRDGSVYTASKGSEIFNLNPTDGTIRWTFNTNDKMEASPAAGTDGKTYFASSGGWVLAMDPKGKPVWQVSVAAPPGFIQMIDAPVVLGLDGLIYVTPRHGTIYALDPKDGRIHWSAPIGGQGVGLNPVAVTSCGAVFARNLQGVLVAISPQGKFIWRVSGGTAGGFSPPAIGKEDHLVLAMGRQLMAYESSA